MVKKLWVLIYAIALSVTIAPKVNSEELQHLSRTELRRLIANAHKSADYQALALYFHYREQVYRAKADLEGHDYAKYFSRYHPKVPTASDNAARLYEYYSAKADRQAEFAAGYDGMLIGDGVQPAHVVQIVSLADLSGQTATQSANSVLAPKTQTMRDSGNLSEK